MNTMWMSSDVVCRSVRDAISREKVRTRRHLRNSSHRSPRIELQYLEIRRLLASVTVNLTGLAEWTDSAAGVHAAPLVYVEIRNLADPVNPVPLATANADLAGNFAKSVNVTLGAGNAIDLFARIYARNPAADVKPDTGAAALTYFMDTASIHVTAGGNFAFPTKIATNTNVGDKSFSIVAATLEASSYAVSLAIPLRKMPSQLDVRYPDAAGGASFFDPPTKQLHITARRVLDWDVIQHEFGHYFMDLYAIDANAGGNHSFGVANAKPAGPGLAWNEGFASWFAIMGQRTINAPYAAGVPAVGNTKYDPTGGPVADFATATGAGETDELSVGSALYHLAVGDQGIKISDKTLFNTAQQNSVKTFGAEWLNLAKSRSGTDRVKIAHVLGLQKIAPVETGPADFSKVTVANVPTFTWTPNGSNDFQLQFFTPDLKKVVFTTADLGNVNSYTPAAADWAKIFDGHTTVRWVVEGKDTTAPATPGSVADAVYGGNLTRYWSEARTLNGPSIALVIDNTGSMSNEISAVIASLNQFITDLQDSLLPGEDPPTIELVTFVDSPSVMISSDDLDAVKAAVNAMFASGGGDTPEPSAVSLQFAANDIAPGGTILLVTDAPSDPGTDLTGTIAQLRAKGVTVNADISGDSGTPEPSLVHAAATTASSTSTPAPATSITSGAAFTTAASATFSPADSAPVSDGPEPVQTDITDPGQTPIALAGSTPATASPLIVDGSVQEGNVGYLVAAPDGSTSTQTDNYYVMQLTAGVAYNIPIYTDQGQYVLARLLGTDGTTVIHSTSTNIGDLGFGAVTIQFTPTQSGSYYLDVAKDFSSAAFTVQVSDSPLVGATSSYTLFSTVATQTGGQFLFKPAIANFPTPDDVTDYKAGILNVLHSTFEPVVLSSNPLTAPAGTTITLHLTGRNTNWINGKSTIAFTNSGAPVSGLSIVSLVVDSPTTLDVTVAVDPATTPEFINAIVTTQLGATTETAVGSNVVHITAAITSPTLLQVLPGSLARGQTTTLIIRGTLTNWDSTSKFTLGPGVTIVSQHVDSPTQITAQVTVDPAAALGFRVATVNTTDTFAFDTQDLAVMILASALAGVPAITGLDITSASQGQLADVALTGSNTNFVQGVTTASFGAGITVTGVDVTDATHAVAHIVVDSAAAIGFRDITVTTGTENAVLLGGFFVSVAQPVTFTGPAAPVVAPLPYLSSVSVAFTVSIPAPLASPVTITYGTADGSAIAGKDYVATGGTVTIPAGQTSATILVPILSRSASNAALTFTLNLSNPSGGISLPVTSQTATIAARTLIVHPFVKGKFSYTSSTGKVITLTLTGPGSGVAYFVAGSKDPADIAINASNGKSSLTISGTNPAIGGIGVNGPIGSISASTARLTGDLIVVGDVSSISLGSPSAGTHNLTLNGPASAAVSLTLTSANGFTISSRQPISNLVATTFTTGMISAPSATLINVTGAFGASLAIPRTIASFHAGTITGGTWNVGSVTALSTTSVAKPFQGIFTGNIGAITVNALSGLFSITGSLKTATIAGNLAATITAASIGSLLVTGNTSGASIRARSTITAFSTGGILNSMLFAGVDPTINTLPTIAGNFNNLRASILSFTVLNSKMYRSSLVAAPTIQLATINGAGPHSGGFAARAIGTLTFTQPGHKAVTFSTTKKPRTTFPTLPGTDFKPTVIP